MRSSNDQPDDAGLDRELERARNEGSDLPPDFTATVMQRVGAAAQRFSILTRWRRRAAPSRFGYTSVGNRGGAVIKKVLIGTVAAAAIVLGIALWTGYPPVPGEGTEATVGAAQRYQAKQMSDKDVVLGDAAAQKFLQSEGFDRLMKNEKARAFLKKASKDPDLKRALTSPELIRLMREQNVAELLAKGNLIVLMRYPEFLTAMKRTDFADAIHSDAFLKLLSKRDIQAALLSKDFLTVMKRADIVQQFAALDLQPQYAALITALNAELAPTLAKVDLIHLLRDGVLVNALSNVQLHNLLTDAALVSWLSQDYAADLFADGLFVDAISQAELIHALQTDGFAVAFTSAAFQSELVNRDR
jgi:hypothetical protein